MSRTEPTDRKEERYRMANSPQSKKRARQNEKRFAVNKARRSRIRTQLRKVEEAIASGDKNVAVDALRAAQPELMLTGKIAWAHLKEIGDYYARLDQLEAEAKSLIHDYTGGVPRQINNVATACLINAAACSLKKITEALVNETMAEFSLP